MPLTIEDKNLSPTSVLHDANKKTMAVYLPQDIILFQIITRVPAKSVDRFKSVSKQWISFLMSDSFRQMHSHNLLKGPHLEDHNVFFFSEKAASLFTIDCESLPNKAPRRCHLPQLEASPPEYMCIQRNIHILTSFHGLVCLGITYDDRRYSDIILWNPLTNEYKMLSKPTNPDHMECFECYGRVWGLYYSSCEDDYKLLVVAQSCNVYLYSLKSDSRRKLNKKPPFKHPFHGYWGPGFFLNENIYLLNMFEGSIRFDTTAERFHKIKTPPFHYNNNNAYATAITVHKGSIHLCVKCNIWRTDTLKSTCIELWKFNADGDIWSKVETYQLMPNDDISYLSPWHLMRNGKWLMWDHRPESNGGCGICQVDLKKKKYNKDKDGHKSKGKNKSKGNCHDEYKLLNCSIFKVGSREEVVYTETFVSPNQYMK